jgi:YHS domain-containing protein
MTDVDALVRQIDQELAAEVSREKAAWAETMRVARERGQRLRRFDAVAQHLIDLLRPRLDALAERFQPVVKVEPVVREHSRAVVLSFAATVANVTLTFEASPDQDVSHVRLDCTQEVVPVVVRHDKQSVLVLPLDGVQDGAVVQWFTERIVAFVKVYVAVVRQDAALRDQLKEYLVEDPVAKIRFPKYLASSTLERDGRTYYFVDEDTRREFENQPAAQ